MKKFLFFTNSKKVIMHKFFAWALSFFIVVGSFSVGKIETEISLVDTAKISAETLVAQFFYLSILPLNVITKLFVESENTSAVPLAPAKNRKDSSKHDNAAQASAGYSIMPGTTDLSQFTRVKNLNFTSSGSDKIKKSSEAACFVNRMCCLLISWSEILFNTNIIMVLLLAILLTRRNIGDDNIVLSIKNTTFARLV